MLELSVLELSGRVRPLRFDVAELVLGGHTARSEEARQQHIEELREIGIEPPAQVPAFWRFSPELLTTGPRLAVQGDDTSGEVEYVLLSAPEGVYVGVGSDQTDRVLEQHSVPRSKQVAGKVMSGVVVPLEGLRDVWDDIEISLDVLDDGEWRPYQRAALARMLAPDALCEMAFGTAAPPVGTAVMGGTVPLLDGVTRFPRQYRGAMRVPGLGEELTFFYSVDALHPLTSQ